MARPKKPPDPEKFTVVNLRLYTEDVEALKRTALDAGEFEWQPRLRRLVHEALRDKKKVLR
jgi:predicted DNA binding CopG/RHH family protein